MTPTTPAGLAGSDNEILHRVEFVLLNNNASDLWVALCKMIDKLRLTAVPPGHTGWRTFDEASEDVHFAAKFVRPRLGQACAQAAMGASGKRYAFVFDNPGANKFVWLELPMTPDEVKFRGERP